MIANKRKIKKIILHCDDNANPLWGLKELEIEHVKVRGMVAIGYHWWIDFDGVQHSTRDENLSGEHCAGHNHDSLGISVHGKHDFPNTQMLSLKKLVLEKCREYNLRADQIYPHCFFNRAKTCPNFLIGPVAEYVHKNLNIGVKK